MLVTSVSDQRMSREVEVGGGRGFYVRKRRGREKGKTRKRKGGFFFSKTLKALMPCDFTVISSSMGMMGIESFF